MKNSLRKQDIISRWGGEEFLALLPETPLGGASLVAERLRKKIADTEIHFADQNLHVTITIGVAEYDERLGMDHSINLADRALYEGKQTGRNKIVLFNPENITEEDLKAAEEELKFVEGRFVNIPETHPKNPPAP
jgi:diguanylate cyclase (GGDEF)-like protein